MESYDYMLDEPELDDEPKPCNCEAPCECAGPREGSVACVEEVA
jgi:hypothetical protein